MILKSFLHDPHLKNGSERLSRCLKTLRSFGKGEIRWPLSCFFLQNHSLSGEDTGIMEKSSFSIVPLDALPWKLTSSCPFLTFLLFYFSFLRSQKNWAYKLKCPFSCPNLCNHIHLAEPWGLETLRTSQRSYFHPDEVLGALIFSLRPQWAFLQFQRWRLSFLSYSFFFFLRKHLLFSQKINTPLPCGVCFLRCTSHNTLGK